MSPSVSQILARERSRGFAHLRGTKLAGRIPIPGEWINQALRDGKPEDSDSPVKGIALAIQDATRGTLLVSLDKWPLPKMFEVPFLWDPKLDLTSPGAPLLRLTHEVTGLLAPAIPIIVGSAKQEGIRAEGRHVTIALGTLLQKHDLGDLIPLITHLELRGVPGKLWLTFELSIPENLDR